MFYFSRLTLKKYLLLHKHRGDDLHQTTQRTKTKMESEISVLIIFTFEEQSCLILDSIFNPLFMIQILDSMCRFHILGLPIFLY